MTDNTNNKTQSKSSIVILIAVIAVISGVIGFGLYQNYSKNNTNTPDEITITQIPTTEEQTTQEVTTVAPTTAEPTTEKPTEKPTTSPPTTEQPTTLFSNNAKEIYSAYCDVINNNETQTYCVYDINHDGIKEIIIELGVTTLEQRYDVYSYDDSKGGAYYTGTLNGSSLLYESYSGYLKGFWAKMGSYIFYDITLKNGRTEETIVINDYTTGEYPPIDGNQLTQSYPNDFNLLVNEILYGEI